MTKLRKRTPRFPQKVRKAHPATNAWLTPQRDHAPKVQHLKPMCGMCGGKIHTRVDFTTGNNWWLCPACDTGPETGMPRAA